MARELMGPRVSILLLLNARNYPLNSYLYTNR